MALSVKIGLFARARRAVWRVLAAHSARVIKRPEFKVLNAIVGFIAIPVVHAFPWMEISAQRLLHDKPVLKDAIEPRAIGVVTGVYPYITPVDSTTTLPCATTDAATMVPGCHVAGEAQRPQGVHLGPITNLFDGSPSNLPTVFAGSADCEATCNGSDLGEALVGEVKELPERRWNLFRQERCLSKGHHGLFLSYDEYKRVPC